MLCPYFNYISTIPVQHYEVDVYTGNNWAADTDAPAFITLYGSKGDSGKRLLYFSTTQPEAKFQKSQVMMLHQFVKVFVIFYGIVI